MLFRRRSPDDQYPPALMGYFVAACEWSLPAPRDGTVAANRLTQYKKLTRVMSDVRQKLQPALGLTQGGRRLTSLSSLLALCRSSAVRPERRTSLSGIRPFWPRWHQGTVHLKPVGLAVCTI